MKVRQLMERYIRGATNELDVLLYKVECWEQDRQAGQSTDEPPTDTIPFFKAVQIGRE